ncbi:MAG: Mur ligase family protein [Candidatus Saccharimonadales bacterium]
MLQQVEYDVGKFTSWVWKLPNLFSLRRRGHLVATSRVKASLVLAYFVWLATIFIPAGYAFVTHNYAWLLLILVAPISVIVCLSAGSFALQTLIVGPAQRKQVLAAKSKLQGMQSTRIGVLGSYGKTTMKELLLTVLSEGLEVAATPGNQNVIISHARWVLSKLKGSERVLIFEYGESQPGDIKRLGGFSSPEYAVVTGLAPAHLDSYPDLQSIVDDFSSIKDYVSDERLYVNGDVRLLESTFNDANLYKSSGTSLLRAKNVSVSFEGTDFTVMRDSKEISFHTGLMGRHQIGPIIAVISIALDLGMSLDQIKAGVSKTNSFEHRMQSRKLSGAWIIDDTYNGNLEGLRAGLSLLSELPAKRKIYVTPGLVDQGEETTRVHNELGNLIAKASPDKVVLMKNSVTSLIESGLKEGSYLGELIIETNPLEFYTNLEHYLASGDVIMMQNDWPDSYQ